MKTDSPCCCDTASMQLTVLKSVLSASELCFLICPPNIYDWKWRAQLPQYKKLELYLTKRKVVIYTMILLCLEYYSLTNFSHKNANEERNRPTPSISRAKIDFF